MCVHLLCILRSSVCHTNRQKFWASPGELHLYCLSLPSPGLFPQCQEVNQVKCSELLYITLVMFLVGHELCFGWAIENTVEKNDLRIFRVGISLKWQEGRGLQRAFLEAWIIFYFQNRDSLSLSAKCQPTCWRKRQGFGKNIMIYIHPSPVSTPQMTPGNSWAKSKCVDSHCRKSHVVAFSSSLSFSLNHKVPTFLQLKAALWITAPFSSVPLVFPEQKMLHS